MVITTNNHNYFYLEDIIMLKETKEFLKETAVKIRKNKDCRKKDKRGNESLYVIEQRIQELKYTYRHYHIACSELRGKTREQIEVPRKDNPANNNYIEKIKKEIKEKYEKTICDCQ
jgi:hypothetical protein